MNQPVLLKVYGNLFPVASDILADLAPCLAACLPEPETAPAAWAGGLLTIAFEGIYFPLAEVLEIMAARKGAQGKLDLLDLEAWRLRRHSFAAEGMTVREAPLNNVLAYSGH